MENIRNKYRLLIIVVMVVMGLTISAVYFPALNSMGDTYKEYAKESIIDTKKTFLKDTVNNVILDIERAQYEQTEYYKDLTNNIAGVLDRGFLSSPETFLNSSIDFFKRSENKEVFSCTIIEKATGKILYCNMDLEDAESFSLDEIIRTMEDTLPVFARHYYGEYHVLLGIGKDVIDKAVKIQMHNKIHSLKFSNDTYIWVNEVVNYRGGDNFAIRRIHPNLKDTEGIYLSTDMTDIKGNLPYLTELEGVKEEGEIFFNYFFKKKNSEIISEKVTYAKLYKEYNWIIAMGVHLDDVQAYVDQTTSHNENNVRAIMFGVTAITLSLIAAALVFLSLLERWYFNNSNKQLKEEIFRDPLTNVYNRRAAINQLTSVFKKYRLTGQNAAIIMIDIDDFKKVNDKYGHDKGDSVLVNTANILSKYIRSTDILCRWGGEEFLLICNGLKKDDALPFTDKLLHAISQYEYECNNDGKKFNITVSMGVSSFKASDTDYNFSVKRADTALYKSKVQGKNQANIE